MTVLSDENEKRFHGSGSTGPFTWTWRFLANADILVYQIPTPDEEDISQEGRTLLVEGYDYYLTGAGSYQGGSLTLINPLAEGEDLLVQRYTNANQAVSIRNQGNNFRPEVHEQVFDGLTMMIQDRERVIGEIRALALSFSVAPVLGAVTARIDIPVSAAGGDVTTDLVGLEEVYVIKTDDSANRVDIIDSSGATFEELAQYRDGLQMKNEGVLLRKLEGDWKKLN